MTLGELVDRIDDMIAAVERIATSLEHVADRLDSVTSSPSTPVHPENQRSVNVKTVQP